jgi:uncharacterized protein YcaQ
MTVPRPISAPAARRFLAVRHFLAPPRSLPAGPDGVMTVMARLGSIQFDPLEVAGRNHDLVLHARVADYTRSVGDALLYELRRLYETYNKGLSLVPTADLPCFRIVWDREHRRLEGAAFDEHSPLVEELLDRIRSQGPLSSTDLEPRPSIDWYWRPTNQVRAILEALAQAGILGLLRREGNRRVYDLVDRLFPADLLAERKTEHEQLTHILLSRYRAHGMLGSAGSAELWLRTGSFREDGSYEKGSGTRTRLRSELIETGRLAPIEVEGVRGTRYVVSDELPLLDAAEQEIASGAAPGASPPAVTLLAPLDPLVWDREFLRTLYGFDYVWEVYVPLRKRRWGYYVLPVMFGDRLVGRIEPRADRPAGAVRVLDMWWEDGFDPMTTTGFVDALAEALHAHRRFLGLGGIVLPRTVRHRALARALRERLENGATSPRPQRRRSTATAVARAPELAPPVRG